LDTVSIQPGDRLERQFRIVCVIAGKFAVRGTFENHNSDQQKMRAVTQVSPDGKGRRSYMEPEIRKIPGVWTGALEVELPDLITVDKQIPEKTAKRQQAALASLEKDDQARSRELLAQAVSDDNWHSVAFCYKVLDARRWAQHHAYLRERIIALAGKGLLDDYWDCLLKDLGESEDWQPYRRRMLPHVAQLANAKGGVMIMDQGLYVATGGQRAAARKLLVQWAEGRSILSQEAKAALDALREEGASTAPATRGEWDEEAYASKPSTFEGGDASFLVKGDWAGVAVCKALAQLFVKTYPKVRIGVQGITARRDSLDLLLNSKANVMIYWPVADPLRTGDEAMKQVFGNLDYLPETYPLGSYVVKVVVNARNSMRRITYTQIRDLLSGRRQARTWEDIGGSGGAVRCYGEGPGSKSRQILKSEILERPDSNGRVFPSFRDNYISCRTSQEVIGRVAKDPDAIGFLLGTDEVGNRVRELAVAQTLSKRRMLSYDVSEGVRFYLPNKENILAKRYSLRAEVILLLAPKAPEAARKYCELAYTTAGNKVCKGQKKGQEPFSGLRQP